MEFRGVARWTLSWSWIVRSLQVLKLMATFLAHIFVNRHRVFLSAATGLPGSVAALL